MPILPRKTVQQLQSYPMPDEGRFGNVRMDFNENTQGFPDAYPQDMPPHLVSGYPEYKDFLEKLSKYYGIAPQNILLTNGSDEALMLVTWTFIEPTGEDVAVISKPCFVVMPQTLKLAGANIREVGVLDDLSFDIAGIETALAAGARLAMFATPENPTGAVIDHDIILKWCANFPQTLFVIDEAYGEYSGTSLIPHIQTTENLIVLKTFSKAWGMAGLRLGVMFGQAPLMEYVNRVKMPFSVNAAAVWTASRLLDKSEQMKQQAQAAMKRKALLEAELAARGYKLVTGKTNSFLLGLGINASAFSKYASKHGVLVRNRSESVFPRPNKSKLWGYVRVNVGTDEENKRFLEVLANFQHDYGVVLDLDGTLVDTSASFDQTVHELVARHSNKPLAHNELCELRSEGGYNDDWVAARELIRRRGKEVSLAVLTKEAVERYLELAPLTESLLCAERTLEALQARYPLYIVTGRTRMEYEPVWSEKLQRYFRRVYCLDDIEGKRPKPHPDYIAHVVEEDGLHSGVYVGNSVDDMQAARAAGLYAIGVATTQPPEVLQAAGADIVLASIESLKEVFML